MIPGLWDTHVHTRYEGIDHLRLFLANGVTTVRDMASPWEHFERIKLWRLEIEAGRRVGPKILASGPLLDGPGSFWSHAAIVEDPESGRALVRRLKEERADFVKVYNRLSRESFLSIAEEARTQALSFVGHVPHSVSAAEASDAGQATIEHLNAILMASSTEERRLRQRVETDGRRPTIGELLPSYSETKANTLFTLLARNHTRVVPTLSLRWTQLAIARRDEDVLGAERLRYVPRSYVEQWASAPRGDPSELQELFERNLAIVRGLHTAGVEVLAGTDVVKSYFVPGFSLHDELALLVSAGLSEQEAIEAATRKPARFFGWADRGTLENGMRADAVLLDANPLEDIRNTSRIAAVMVRGRLFEREAVAGMLEEAERTASRWTEPPTGR